MSILYQTNHEGVFQIQIMFSIINQWNRSGRCLAIIMSPTEGDPVSLSVGVSVTFSCLHDIS